MSPRPLDPADAMSMAASYERYFVPTIGTPVARQLIESAALRPGERVLDVACGTGAVTRLAVERVGPEGAVAGLDPNPAMLAVARETVSPDPPADWHEAPAEAIPLPDGSVDVVLCGMGLQFFTDREAGLREVRRVLRPLGRFVANVPGPIPPPLQIMAEELARHVGPESASFVHLVFALHDADEIHGLVRDAGFDDVDVRSTAVGLELPPPGEFLWQYVESTPLAAAVANLDEEGRAALGRDYAARCGDFVEDGALAGAVRMTTVIAHEAV